MPPEPKTTLGPDGLSVTVVEGAPKVDLLVTAEKRMARSLGAPVWRITGEFPFDKERLEKQPELCERDVIDALLAAMLKGPQGPTS